MRKDHNSRYASLSCERTIALATHLCHGEDEDLRQTEHQRSEPGHCHQSVSVAGRPHVAANDRLMDPVSPLTILDFLHYGLRRSKRAGKAESLLKTQRKRYLWYLIDM
ncbi:hypothetical protein ElyMa_003079300 [Elysia marginata]|uniref:Uncharacterized protein n=1 Tax=Elysia marginata TaxID=1093978 RepID=A0AAV4INA2_9GAST|nr:hypothetical protein ElyMa_003079300 [Elysia marginata]